MSTISDNSLTLIDDIINKTEARNLNFYPSVLDMMSSAYKDFLISIFFIENTDYSLKASIFNNKISNKGFKINHPDFIDFLTNNKKTLLLENTKIENLKNNTLFVKLSIKDSIFGFCLLSSNEKISKEILKTFPLIANVLSYKIKDFELTEVFKMQLKALQEAIEEKQAAYEIIEKQHKKLQELEKTKSLFLANISHELRTPLNAIIGFSQALGSKIFGTLNKKQEEYIKDIQISGLHLLGMINEILDLSKLEVNAMKFSPIELNPNQTIKEVVNILEPLYKDKNIKVIFNNEFEGLIKADYQKFQQILFNLLSNAIKFTNENGKIEIFSEFKNKNYILKIKDDGIGIEKKNQKKIFKKFVHLNNVYIKNQNSTGLGLTITKELVKLHNGTIKLDSELNKGTTFTLEFKKIIL